MSTDNTSSLQFAFGSMYELHTYLGEDDKKLSFRNDIDTAKKAFDDRKKEENPVGGVYLFGRTDMKIWVLCHRSVEQDLQINNRPDEMSALIAATTNPEFVMFYNAGYIPLDPSLLTINSGLSSDYPRYTCTEIMTNLVQDQALSFRCRWWKSLPEGFHKSVCQRSAEGLALRFISELPPGAAPIKEPGIYIVTCFFPEGRSLVISGSRSVILLASHGRSSIVTNGGSAIYNISPHAEISALDGSVKELIKVVNGPASTIKFYCAQAQNKSGEIWHVGEKEIWVEP